MISQGTHGFIFLERNMRYLINLKSLRLLAQGQTQGSTLQQCTKNTLTTGPFGNTCEENEVSLEVEAGGVAGLKCLQPS